MIIIWIIGGAIILFLLFVLIDTNRVRLTNHTLPSPGSFHTTVVHLTDLHGRTRFINGSISAKVNRLHPDHIIITGDLASRKRQLKRVLKEIGKLHCSSIVFVPGNYERETWSGIRKRRYSEQEYRDIIQSLQLLNVNVLTNSSILLQQGLIYGFDNSIYGNERLTLSREELERSAYTIMLAHSPSIIDLLHESKLPFDLLLAGHTHGGQIRLWGRTIGAYKHFHIGLKALDNRRHFYINRGLGTVKIPVRIGCPPEIAVFRIGRQDGPA